MMMVITSKSLLAIAREPEFAAPNKCSLSELKAALRMHNACKSVRNRYLDTLYAVTRTKFT